MARITEPRAGAPEVGQAHPNLFGLLVISCIPLAAIAAILFSAGGTGPGFLIPALTCGVVIGMLVFMAFWDGPAR